MSTYKRTTKDWDRHVFPPADHELSDNEITTKYGDLIAAYVLNIANSPDLDSLTRLARAGEELAQRAQRRLVAATNKRKRDAARRTAERARTAERERSTL